MLSAQAVVGAIEIAAVAGDAGCVRVAVIMGERTIVLHSDDGAAESYVSLGALKARRMIQALSAALRQIED